MENFLHQLSIICCAGADTSRGVEAASTPPPPLPPPPPLLRCSAAPLWQPQKRPTPVFASTLSQWKRLAAHRKFKGTFLISDKAPQLNGSAHILMDVTG